MSGFRPGRPNQNGRRGPKNYNGRNRGGGRGYGQK